MADNVTCLDMSPDSWPPRALVALAKLCVPARMLAAVVDMKLETLLRTLATAS